MPEANKGLMTGIRTNNLNLNIDLNKTFAERVDLDKSGINSAVKATELRNQANISLGHRFVWVWTDNTAGNSTQSSDT